MQVKRTGIIIKPDINRVLLKAFEVRSEKRLYRIISQILILSEKDCHIKIEEVINEFGNRHQNLTEFFRNRFWQVNKYIPIDTPISDVRKLLIGAYFSHEFSVEAAALFNPSMVWHPDQSDMPEGNRRFILSLRATGEGHISSITFRSGVIDSNSNISMDPSDKYITGGEITTKLLNNKNVLEEKIRSLGLLNNFSTLILSRLENSFTITIFENCINELLAQVCHQNDENIQVANNLLSLVKGNYERIFSEKFNISQRVIFPASPSEISGIEDARFVQFQNDNGKITYYAIYTAFDSFTITPDGEYTIQPQLIETEDFLHFNISTFYGSEVKNKGMALFPRKINGQFVTLSRQDGETNYIMFSDNLYSWNSKHLIQEPEYPWELIQIGNCGSPIETEAGWLVLSHGVGPMRKYSISAFLLDLNDPTKLIGKLKKPLLSPNKTEREGYVPNVVYSCGSQIHNGELILPYAMSDYACTFATINLGNLLKELTS